MIWYRTRIIQTGILSYNFYSYPTICVRLNASISFPFYISFCHPVNPSMFPSSVVISSHLIFLPSTTKYHGAYYSPIQHFSVIPMPFNKCLPGVPCMCVKRKGITNSCLDSPDFPHSASENPWNICSLGNKDLPPPFAMQWFHQASAAEAVFLSLFLRCGMLHLPTKCLPLCCDSEPSPHDLHTPKWIHMDQPGSSSLAGGPGTAWVAA